MPSRGLEEGFLQDAHGVGFDDKRGTKAPSQVAIVASGLERGLHKQDSAGPASGGFCPVALGLDKVGVTLTLRKTDTAMGWPVGFRDETRKCSCVPEVQLAATVLGLLQAIRAWSGWG